MQPITVRKMKFPVPGPGEFHPLCIAGSSVLSYTHLATSLYAAQLEPFLVLALRRVAGRIRDATLREEVERFSRQEAQHYRRHIDFNRAIFAQGYPGLEARVEALKRDFDRFLAEKPDRFCVGFVEGFESFTTQFALAVLGSGLYDHPRTARPIGELFKWHMLEEVEHRNVAYDVYRHLYGGYLHRARLCWVAQRHMLRFMADCMRLMSSFDVPRYGEGCRVTRRQRFGIARSNAGMRLISMLPGYSPHRHAVPPRIAELSAHYTRIAESTH
jgi:predicted metal-dependent hydrolase